MSSPSGTERSSATKQILHRLKTSCVCLPLWPCGGHKVLKVTRSFSSLTNVRVNVKLGENFLCMQLSNLHGSMIVRSHIPKE